VSSALHDPRLKILHLIHVLGETNSQYNEHALPEMHARDISICTYFNPRLEYPSEITVFHGDDTVRGFFRALRAALDAKDYDAIHAHSPQTVFLLTLALIARPRRFKLWKSTVFTAHDSFYDFKPRNKLLMFPAFAAFRRVVFCGKAAYASFPASWRRIVGGRAHIVQNSADLDRVERALASVERGGGDPMFTVVSIGRLEKVKDPETLVTAFEKASDERSRLVLIGAGSLQAQLEQHVRSSPAASRIELTGLIPRVEVFARCARADLFVSSSRGEGLPVGVMEAMAAGCPTVLSDIPPHREIVEGVDFVPIVAPGDVDGFAHEIERFRSMPEQERAAIGQRCRELVRDRFALARMRSGYQSVYRELRAGARSAP
jgi:glycosyltransferase involved in cell wall biosynthesis